jgi:hypothetical protein
MIDTVMALWNRWHTKHILRAFIAFLLIFMSITLLLFTINIITASPRTPTRTGKMERLVKSKQPTVHIPTVTPPAQPASATPTLIPTSSVPCPASPTPPGATTPVQQVSATVQAAQQPTSDPEATATPGLTATAYSTPEITPTSTLMEAPTAPLPTPTATPTQETPPDDPPWVEKTVIIKTPASHESKNSTQKSKASYTEVTLEAPPVGEDEEQATSLSNYNANIAASWVSDHANTQVLPTRCASHSTDEIRTPALKLASVPGLIMGSSLLATVLFYGIIYGFSALRKKRRA